MTLSSYLVVGAAVLGFTGIAHAQQLDCGFQPPEYWLAEIQKAVARGEIDDPARRPLPEVRPREVWQAVGGPPCLAIEHVFAYEDSNSVLVTNFSDGQLFSLMGDAANEVMQAHGDNFDFVGFWLSFAPHHELGAAFYLGLENDVTGIGQSMFNARSALGLAGQNIEGLVMMWDINHTYWQPGTGPNADFTRTVLGQEFEHRFGMFLPALIDGRSLQGTFGCGRGAHWNFKVDGQGSGMEIAEWVGDNPAVPVALDNSFNTDIGGVFSYPDLYLMGMVSPQELDTDASEFRYMNDSDCSSNYFGTITSISSGEIIASAGPRVPDSTNSQKDFRTAWIIIHLPNDPPSQSELQKTADILAQHEFDWKFGTLDRGTMDNSLFSDCNCNGLPDLDETTSGITPDCNGNGIPDECDIANGTSRDAGGDGIPDECCLDCTPEDILWRHDDGRAYIWLMDGTNRVGQGSPGSAGPEWEIVGVGDFDGDGQSDILWRNMSTGAVFLWFIEGTDRIGSGQAGVVSLEWQIVATGNFDGDPDGRSDILWRNTSTGQVFIWLMNGTQRVGEGSPGTAGQAWQIAGTGDFDGDGRLDILWRHTVSGHVFVWFVDGTQRVGQGSLGVIPLVWQIVGTGNFDGDIQGRSDILWRRDDGQVDIWLLDGTEVTQLGSAGATGVDWQIVATADFSGDGTSDILWRHSVSGFVYIWFMRGTDWVVQGPVGGVPHVWQILGGGDFNGQ